MLKAATTLTIAATVVAYFLSVQMPRKYSPIGAEGLTELCESSRLATMRRFGAPLCPGDLNWYGRQMLPHTMRELTASAVMHLLHLHGQAAVFNGGPIRSGNDLLASLLDGSKAEELFGAEFLRLGRNGIRPLNVPDKANPRACEAHRDQLLACLAELSVPLSYPINVDGNIYCVRDILKDSMANFHLRQEEIGWTAIAYVRYLAPNRCWANRYGEVFTFDALASSLVNRPLFREACGGAHALEALVQIVHVDARTQVLSTSIRRLVQEHLCRAFRSIVSVQLEDGSFPVDWNAWAPGTRMFVVDNSDEWKLLATSHLVEIMLLLPQDIYDSCVGDGVALRAVKWLRSRVKSASPGDFEKHFCAYSHSFHILRHLAMRSGGALLH